ncbi:MAG: hypothetical protein HYU27_00945 [Acidobacteria bacterium]|nr:hypothetical protein [Acidobacteriota bacterium]
MSDLTTATILAALILVAAIVSVEFGISAGIIDRRQFTILLAAVIASAVIPTIVAQRWFAPPVHALKTEEIAEVEDEEFEPPRIPSA